MISNQQILEKYSSTISEEVNVKHLSLLWDDIQVIKTYVPLGQKLSGKFWKDTGRIIWAAKQGSVEELENGQIKVIQWNDSWVLEGADYEIRFSWLDEKKQTVEDGIIIDLDLELTNELIAEGIAREISRFLNQMRKDANYNVSDRVQCFWKTESKTLSTVMHTFSKFLSTEALLSKVLESDNQWDLQKIFESEEGEIVFSFKK